MIDQYTLAGTHGRTACKFFDDELADDAMLSMTYTEKMKAVVESAQNKQNATVWLDRFRQIRKAAGPQRIPSARPSHKTPKQR